MNKPLGSIVIAAHNEAAVLGRTLGHLSSLAREGAVDVVVVPNGCIDRTAEVARRFAGVRVHELEEASKTAALRVGDRVAVPGPRIYLDADVDLTAGAAMATMRALSRGAVAARPPRQFDTTGAVWAVRRWYSVREQLAAVSEGLFGAGCYGLSVEGRERFDEFPDVLADDMFIDSLFAPDEITIVPTDPVIVRTPRTVKDQVLILRRKNRAVREAANLPRHELLPERRQSHAGEVRALVKREPRRLVDAAVYVTLILHARVRSRVGPPPRWERDESSRTEN